MYVYKDKDGVALYVGMTNCFKRRHAQHQSKKWAKDIASYEVWPCANESNRLIAETVMIFRLRPRFNRLIKLRLDKDGDVSAARW